MNIIFGKHKLSKFEYSPEDYALINRLNYIDYVCERLDGYIVKEDDITSNDDNTTYHFNTSKLILSKLDYPEKSIDQFLDDLDVITNDFNKIHIENCKRIINFGHSKFILSTIDFPNITESFLEQSKIILENEYNKYEHVEKSTSTQIIPCGKYSTMVVAADDFQGLKHPEVERLIKDLIYIIFHLYDNTQPLKTVESVNSDFILKTFENLTESIMDNKELDIKNISNLVEQLLCGQIETTDIASAIKKMGLNF